MALIQAKLSPICTVNFAGWRSDTLSLQRAGWDIAIFIEEIKDNLFLCITDAGSELKLNMAELEELFYLPIFTCDPDTHLGYQHYLSNMEPE